MIESTNLALGTRKRWTVINHHDSTEAWGETWAELDAPGPDEFNFSGARPMTRLPERGVDLVPAEFVHL